MTEPAQDPESPLRRGAERLNAFSDAVIAVIITIMVLELKAPDEASLPALTRLWPTVLSYAVSYLFIAIIWTNHHHLMRFVQEATSRLIWLNFLHLFMVSFVPFATQWVARTRLGDVAVSAYAVVFVCVDAAYLAFQSAVLAQADPRLAPLTARNRARTRAVITMAIFAVAAAVALVLPEAGFVLICLALSFFLRPEVRGLRPGRPRGVPPS